MPLLSFCSRTFWKQGCVIPLFFQLKYFEINNDPSSFISCHLCTIKLCQELRTTQGSGFGILCHVLQWKEGSWVHFQNSTIRHILHFSSGNTKGTLTTCLSMKGACQGFQNAPNKTVLCDSFLFWKGVFALYMFIPLNFTSTHLRHTALKCEVGISGHMVAPGR